MRRSTWEWHRQRRSSPSVPSSSDACHRVGNTRARLRRKLRAPAAPRYPRIAGRSTKWLPVASRVNLSVNASHFVAVSRVGPLSGCYVNTLCSCLIAKTSLSSSSMVLYRAGVTRTAAPCEIPSRATVRMLYFAIRSF